MGLKASRILNQKWDLVPSNLQDICDLRKFKKAIKQWKPECCPWCFSAKCRFSGKNNLKRFKLLKSNKKCYSKFDILRLSNTNFCAVCGFLRCGAVCWQS